MEKPYMNFYERFHYALLWLSAENHQVWFLIEVKCELRSLLSRVDCMINTDLTSTYSTGF